MATARRNHLGPEQYSEHMSDNMRLKSHEPRSILPVQIGVGAAAGLLLVTGTVFVTSNIVEARSGDETGSMPPNPVATAPQVPVRSETQPTSLPTSEAPLNERELAIAKYEAELAPEAAAKLDLALRILEGAGAADEPLEYYYREGRGGSYATIFQTSNTQGRTVRVLYGWTENPADGSGKGDAALEVQVLFPQGYDDDYYISRVGFGGVDEPPSGTGLRDTIRDLKKDYAGGYLQDIGFYTMMADPSKGEGGAIRFGNYDGADNRRMQIETNQGKVINYDEPGFMAAREQLRESDKELAAIILSETAQIRKK